MECFRHHRHPDIYVFDNNCSMKRWLDNHMNTETGQFFHKIGLPVDPFHFNAKHKETDEYCQLYCDPKRFTALLAENGSYYFNTSIAEQTNNWLGRYNATCREMRASRFNFFLDEMILRRNRHTIDELERKGEEPTTW